MSHQARGYRVSTSEKKEKEKKSYPSLIQIRKLIGEKKSKYIQNVLEECISLQITQIPGIIIKNFVHSQTHICAFFVLHTCMHH